MQIVAGDYSVGCCVVQLVVLCTLLRVFNKWVVVLCTLLCYPTKTCLINVTNFFCDRVNMGAGDILVLHARLASPPPPRQAREGGLASNIYMLRAQFVAAREPFLWDSKGAVV